VKQPVDKAYLHTAPVRCGEGNTADPVASPVVDVAGQDVSDCRVIDYGRLDKPCLARTRSDASAKFLCDLGLTQAGR
jgi:hypothetical protein